MKETEPTIYICVNVLPFDDSSVVVGAAVVVGGTVVGNAEKISRKKNKQDLLNKTCP